MTLFIATPCFGGMVNAEFLNSLLHLKTARVASQIVIQPGSSLISHARNVLASQFLDSSCDRLLFIDSDIIFAPTDVEKIASNQEAVVGGICALKHSDRLQVNFHDFLGMSSQSE